MQDSDPNRLSILLITDVFPPRSGGSGWSTYYLGKALSGRGHRVKVLRPRYDLRTARPMIRHTAYGGLQVEELALPGAPAWTRRVGLDRAWRERQAVRYLARRAARLVHVDGYNILHGQHKVSALAASTAALHARGARGGNAAVASVATVRDYWPLCPVSTRLFNTVEGKSVECKECHRLGRYLASVRAENKASVPSRLLTLARWIATWQAARSLARCDATVAVSRYVRDQLVLSGRVPGNRLYNIPNLVDLPSVDRALSGEWPLHDISPEQTFLLFVGKWDVNKGAAMLPEAIAQSEVKMPVVLLGEGPLKGSIEEEARCRGLDFRFFSWLDNDAVLRVMRSARALLFPSAWQEPLSRVLLEGCACGAAIVALDTGGTGDIITHGASGWLAPDMTSFVEGIRRVSAEDALNRALREGARRKAETVFAAPVVAAQMEQLYYNLLAELQEGTR
jgi:glycogen(starch) synthase